MRTSSDRGTQSERQKGAKGSQKGAKSESKVRPIQHKIRRPMVGRVRVCKLKGEVYLPLPPPPWDPSPANPRTNSSIRTLCVYWDHTLAQIPKILRRGGS